MPAPEGTPRQAPGCTLRGCASRLGSYVVPSPAQAPFGAPPSGEWGAEQLLAQIVAVDTAITAGALLMASGQRPSYDNRPSLDGWNLSRIVTAGLAGWPTWSAPVCSCSAASPSSVPPTT